MKAGRSSVTAQATALARALELRRPATERLFEDRFACAFLEGWARALLRLLCAPAIGAAMTWLLDPLILRARDSLAARTLHIDEALEAELAAGLSQLVILGAGFDSRSLRIRGIERARIFEVDHPATQARKRIHLAKMHPGESVHVVFVALDFDRERLDDALANAGFRTDTRAFFVWEGVTEYLSAEAVDRTLRFVSATAPGSRIAFTYKDSRVVRGTLPLPGARWSMACQRLVGEPCHFGLDPTGIAAYLAARGLTLVEDVGDTEREARHLPASRRTARAGDFDRTALAEVPSV